MVRMATRAAAARLKPLLRRLLFDPEEDSDWGNSLSTRDEVLPLPEGKSTLDLLRSVATDWSARPELARLFVPLFEKYDEEDFGPHSLTDNDLAAYELLRDATDEQTGAPLFVANLVLFNQLRMGTLDPCSCGAVPDFKCSQPDLDYLVASWWYGGGGGGGGGGGSKESRPPEVDEALWLPYECWDETTEVIPRYNRTVVWHFIDCHVKEEYGDSFLTKLFCSAFIHVYPAAPGWDCVPLPPYWKRQRDAELAAERAVRLAQPRLTPEDLARQAEAARADRERRDKERSEAEQLRLKKEADERKRVNFRSFFTSSKDKDSKPKPKPVPVLVPVPVPARMSAPFYAPQSSGSFTAVTAVAATAAAPAPASASASASVVTPAPPLTAEQRERMETNRLKALERRALHQQREKERG